MQHKKIKFRYNEKEIIIPAPVVKTLFGHRQPSASSPERGGLLFGQVINGDTAIISVVRELKPEQSGPFFCYFSSKTENKIIKKEYKEGNYLLGKWHTHYECSPVPSHTDIASMKEYYVKSKHNMPFFLMLIVGKDGSLYLGGFNDREYEFK